ncbi:hypothetical protein [Oligoflexus tunisiensis]|uniref:hypothetical protein n=1 Tax=Oligoflexus tunisiensis TaxID=708132 RepID=UPI00114CB7F6|nr:hypothetical protein [Oligoflexus tunisiensis]
MYMKPGLGISMVLLLSSIGLPTHAWAGDSPAQEQAVVIDQLTEGWPEKPRDLARVLAQKYGMPDESTSKMLVWENRGPFKRTILRREEVPHNMPKPHTDFLEQVIAFRVPTDRFNDVGTFDGSIVIRRTDGEMSATCDKEENNIVSLNVAFDVVQRSRTVDEARHFLARTIAELAAGQTPGYAQELKFPTQSIVDARDPDVPVSPE